MTNHPDLLDMSAEGIADAFANRTLSPVEAADACLTRAEQINPGLNAFTVIDHQGARTAAQAAETRWRQGRPLSPIDGVPVTVKDLFLCHGADVRYGSLTTADSSRLPDAPSVRRLRDAGAVILGLTTTPEFGWKAVTDSPRSGVSRNPWDASKTPGGSSGGAAIAAATGAGLLHLGTDGGGSIRIPASFCGIVGHKPTFGRVPVYPPSAFGTVAHVAPMAKTVGDLILMLNVISGRDLRDWTQSAMSPPTISSTKFEWRGARVGYWSDPCAGQVEDEVGMIVRAAVDDLAQAGARIEPMRLPNQEVLLDVFRCLWHVGAATRLMAVAEGARQDCDPGFLAAAALGSRYSAVEHAEAHLARAQFGLQMDALLDSYDLVVSPSVAVAAFDAGGDVPAGSTFATWIEWASFSFPLNLSQQPACSVPCGRTTLGLPVGLQIIGARGADQKVLSAALCHEQTSRDLARSLSWRPKAPSRALKPCACSCQQSGLLKGNHPATFSRPP